MRVHRISLPLSNAFLIQDKKNILVDSGCYYDLPNLLKQIDELGVKLSDIALVVLTHVHFDHCGCAAELRKFGIPVMASASSQENLLIGAQEGLQKFYLAQAVFSAIQRRGKVFGFPGVMVDIPIHEECSLEEFGVGGRVLQTPGHTESSLSLILDDHSACVGDLLMGGIMGLPPAWKPALHPLSSDIPTCVQHVRRLRTRGIQRFFVGHGDVLEAPNLDSWLENFDQSF